MRTPPKRLGELEPVTIQGFELDDADPVELRQALDDLGVGQPVIVGDLRAARVVDAGQAFENPKMIAQIYDRRRTRKASPAG